MSTQLLHTLLNIALEPVDSDRISWLTTELKTATRRDWQRCFAEMQRHRLLPLVAHTFLTRNLTDLVPQPYCDRMMAAHSQTNTENTIRLLTLEAILRKMAQRHLHPILWKGIVLADSFYPHPGTRPMGDIDFAIPSEELAAATEVFESLGLKQIHDATTEDAVYFGNAFGVVCDVHHRVRLFEGKESLDLTTELKPQHTNAEVFPVLGPNAMVAHLVFHMNGHYDETGPVLLWILDLAFVLRKWGELIQPEILQKLLPSAEHFESLLRIVRFLEEAFNESFPQWLSAEAKRVQPLTLAEILKQRHWAIWKLDRPRGWIKFMAYKLGILPKIEQILKKSIPAASVSSAS
ncbi:MAG TPA: nucleotidyltransferase family protein [Oscillatoriales cyanobacterium M59_W2019_021]|nr:nucleotidyltransferase family protein [Oscillatoriales cyanobacterium M4454_W2019_049]HIK49573.1 nucleotidyltransferase family protein [Oscillatoriales cyanobacterium M59_W2019_021]